MVNWSIKVNARVRGLAMTKERPTAGPGGQPFVDPPWGAFLDVDSVLASMSPDSKIAGMFFIALVGGAKARGVVLPSARERYMQFAFYPVADLVRLLVEACERFYPDRPLRQSLRKLGAFAPSAFLASTLGKVTLGSTDGVHAAVAAMANAYALNVRPSKLAVVDSGSNWAIVQLDQIQYFLDSHHVGVFEGTIRYAGATGSAQIASRSATSADLLLSWDP
jgi:uncharacterized protein (TIGR02265 family)